MKLKLTMIVLALSLLAGAKTQAQVSTSYWQNVNIVIPDDNPNGLFSTIQVGGLAGSLAFINVSLDIANSYNGDLYAYLVNPNGDLAVLLNRVGVGNGDPFGYGDNGFDVAFSDTATNDIHLYQAGSYTLNGSGQLTGTWAADGRNIDPDSTPLVFDAAAPTATLGSLLGTGPDGTWTLFIADMSGGYEGTLVSWQLQIGMVPEPPINQLLAASGAFGAACFAGRKARRNFRK